VSSIKRDSTHAHALTGENFLYVFKGARSAPRGLVAAYANAPREVGTWPSAAHGLSVVG
jgi:hypothetical protein